MALFRLSIKPTEAGQVVGDFSLRTTYQTVMMPLTYTAVRQTLTVSATRFVFPPTFPSQQVMQTDFGVDMPAERPLFDHVRMHDLFVLPTSDPLTIEGVWANDSRFLFEGSEEVVQGLETPVNAEVRLGSIIFDPSLGRDDENYMPKVRRKMCMPTANIGISQNDLNEAVRFHRTFRQLHRSGRTNITAQLYLRTKGSNRPTVVDLQASLYKPSVLTQRSVDFPMTQLKHTSTTNITLKNPSRLPLIVEVVGLDALQELKPELVAQAFSMSAEKFSRLLEFQSSFSAREAALAPGAQATSLSPTRLLIEPNGMANVTLHFRPESLGDLQSALVVVNNLTILEAMVVSGRAGKGSFGFPKTQRHIVDGNLTLALKASDLSYCTAPGGISPSDAERRFGFNFTVVNRGTMSVQVTSMGIGNVPCAADGFEILNCEPFELQPKKHYKLSIAYTPDFTQKRVARKLTVMLQGADRPITFPLVASVPEEMLSACFAGLPRPSWAVHLKTVLLLGILAACAAVLFYDRNTAPDEWWQLGRMGSVLLLAQSSAEKHGKEANGQAVKHAEGFKAHSPDGSATVAGAAAAATTTTTATVSSHNHHPHESSETSGHDQQTKGKSEKIASAKVGKKGQKTASAGSGSGRSSLTGSSGQPPSQARGTQHVNHDDEDEDLAALTSTTATTTTSASATTEINGHVRQERRKQVDSVSPAATGTEPSTVGTTTEGEAMTSPLAVSVVSPAAGSGKDLSNGVKSSPATRRKRRQNKHHGRPAGEGGVDSSPSTPDLTLSPASLGGEPPTIVSSLQGQSDDGALQQSDTTGAETVDGTVDVASPNADNTQTAPTAGGAKSTKTLSPEVASPGQEEAETEDDETRDGEKDVVSGEGGREARSPHGSPALQRRRKEEGGMSLAQRRHQNISAVASPNSRGGNRSGAVVSGSPNTSPAGTTTTGSKRGSHSRSGAAAALKQEGAIPKVAQPDEIVAQAQALAAAALASKSTHGSSDQGSPISKAAPVGLMTSATKNNTSADGNTASGSSSGNTGAAKTVTSPWSPVSSPIAKDKATSRPTAAGLGSPLAEPTTAFSVPAVSSIASTIAAPAPAIFGVLPDLPSLDGGLDSSSGGRFNAGAPPFRGSAATTAPSAFLPGAPLPTNTATTATSAGFNSAGSALPDPWSGLRSDNSLLYPSLAPALSKPAAGAGASWQSTMNSGTVTASSSGGGGFVPQYYAPPPPRNNADPIWESASRSGSAGETTTDFLGAHRASPAVGLADYASGARGSGWSLSGGLTSEVGNNNYGGFYSSVPRVTGGVRSEISGAGPGHSRAGSGSAASVSPRSVAGTASGSLSGLEPTGFFRTASGGGPPGFFAPPPPSTSGSMASASTSASSTVTSTAARAGLGAGTFGFGTMAAPTMGLTTQSTTGSGSLLSDPAMSGFFSSGPNVWGPSSGELPDPLGPPLDLDWVTEDDASSQTE